MIGEGKIILQRDKMTFVSSFCVLNKDAIDLDQYLHFLHRKELRYLETLKFEKRRSNFLMGRVAAKTAISKLSDEPLDSIAIEYGVFKFPIVKSIGIHNIQIGISHTKNIGFAIAFPEEHPMGIDVEIIDDNRVNTIRKFITEKELGLIANIEKPFNMTSTLVWSVKESISKIFKTGLTMDFNVLEMKTLIKKGDFYISTFQNIAQYKGISYQNQEYIFSLVLPKNTVIDLEVYKNTIDQILNTECNK
ncbi:4'-phosphopantetheinyl transferase family protein [uncultured Aquimarina sp.]|uniref:4'-phosphopantetheinyl transferase family protein n=1 Tax=uncultured Aquimarina sp. TaxID=575652 RepID=UPI00262D18FE|nr:4'-phosphopantetheinyl transferase superfamily protein [uncultured Aquimarina sp.]